MMPRHVLVVVANQILSERVMHTALIRMKSPLAIRFLLGLAIYAFVVSASQAGVLPGLSTLSESDIRQSAIAFVNMATSPGLEGATVNVDQENRQSDQWRSSLGFNAEFTLRDHIYNGYWGVALVGGELKDNIELIADNNQPVQLDLTRQVVALRGSLGLSLPINQYFKIRPYLTLVLSDMQSESFFEGLPGADPLNNPQTTLHFQSNAQVLSTIGSAEAVYFRWFGDYKVDLSAHYNLIYSTAVSENNPILNTEDWDHTVQLKSRFSGPTELITAARPWRWNAYANYINFLSHSEASLGYNRLLEFGAGLDWKINIKPLDWFGWEYLGISAGLIIGGDVEGYNVGLTAR